ncbi:MAG: hypothetical protein E5W57_04090 [Mesorhizobium sp.]|nr:MAG: hypothetical protein E5W57_04090 [Mesorhizobium sp.]
MSDKVRLTQAQRHPMVIAAADRRGIVEYLGVAGLRKAGWTYVHGGYEITDAGRAALAED